MMGEAELEIPLANGCRLCCGEGEDYRYGGYLRIIDKDNNEVLFWESTEWQEDPESVMGAVFSAALTPFEELVKDRELIDGVWVYKKRE
jgi:hypothetical protein